MFASHSFIHSHFLSCTLLKIVDAGVMIGDGGLRSGVERLK